MANARQEDLLMKIPALLHLSRLGYGYLSRAQVRNRDRRTNIFPDTLKAAIERINGVRLSAERFARLTESLREQLDAEDLGKQFYETIRDGWQGLRVIDFERPENNLFQSACELSCGSGAGSFRPDITLFVNGLPLAVIEVKVQGRGRGLQAEYDRMLERSRGQERRRYLQCIQVWAFADDDKENPDGMLPTKGASFATGSAGDIPVYAIRGRGFASVRRLAPRNTEEEQRILEDNGIPARPHSRIFNRSLSPQKPAHQLMTALFTPGRFLLLLRHGIQYTWEAEPGERVLLTRRMATARHLAMLEQLTRKARRGYRNWTVPSCGAAGEQTARAALVSMLRDLLPGAELYWVSNDHAGLQRDRSVLESCGISVRAKEKAANPSPVLMTAGEALALRLPEAENHGTGVRRVYILPQQIPRYGQRGTLLSSLRRADPDAILIMRKAGEVQENSFSTILLQKEMPRRRASCPAD